MGNAGTWANRLLNHWKLVVAVTLVSLLVVVSSRARRPNIRDLTWAAARRGDIETLIRYARAGHRDAFRRLGDPRLGEAEPVLRQFLTVARSKVYAATALAKMDVERNLPCLLSLLADPDPEVRDRVIKELRVYPRWDVAWAIAVHLDDYGMVRGGCLPSWCVAHTASDTLGWLFAVPGHVFWEEPTGDEMMVAMASGASRPTAESRSAALWREWLAEHDGEDFLSIILGNARREEVMARRTAADRLAQYPCQESLDCLRELMDDPHPAIREEATKSHRRVKEAIARLAGPE